MNCKTENRFKDFGDDFDDFVQNMKARSYQPIKTREIMGTE